MLASKQVWSKSSSCRQREWYGMEQPAPFIVSQSYRRQKSNRIRLGKHQSFQWNPKSFRQRATDGASSKLRRCHKSCHVGMRSLACRFSQTITGASRKMSNDPWPFGKANVNSKKLKRGENLARKNLLEPVRLRLCAQRKACICCGGTTCILSYQRIH